MTGITLMHEQLRGLPVPALARYLFWRMSPGPGDRRIVFEGNTGELARVDVNDYRVRPEGLGRFDREQETV
jgi:hypothetical protein